MKKTVAIAIVISSILFGIFLGATWTVAKETNKNNRYPTIPIEQLDSLRKVYRVNIEVNDIYLHGEIYKIKD